MARLFESDSKEELQATASAFGGCFALTFVFLIPIAGFFWFVWQPLGKGLLFIAVFTCVWTAAVVLSTLREAGLRKKESKG
jgi:Kef-type K+ transport system membrane component KefB